MALPIPETMIETSIASPWYMRTVYERVMEQVFLTPRGHWIDEGGEAMATLEINEDDRELVPLLVREDAEEVWLIFRTEDDTV